MARSYGHIDDLAAKMERTRLRVGLSFASLGKLAGVDQGQAYRICNGQFSTLNPSVLKICNALGLSPQTDPVGGQPDRAEDLAEILRREVILAWDGTRAGAMRIRRVLKALED